MSNTSLEKGFDSIFSPTWETKMLVVIQPLGILTPRSCPDSLLSRIISDAFPDFSQRQNMKHHFKCHCFIQKYNSREQDLGIRGIKQNKWGTIFCCQFSWFLPQWSAQSHRNILQAEWWSILDYLLWVMNRKEFLHLLFLLQAHGLPLLGT